MIRHCKLFSVYLFLFLDSFFITIVFSFSLIVFSSTIQLYVSSLPAFALIVRPFSPNLLSFSIQ